MSSSFQTSQPRATNSARRNQLFRGAIADARRQLDTIRAKAGADADAAEIGWRGRNPGLAALIDHAEGNPR